MTSVLTALSTSLDGFIAGADDSPKQPLGMGGERVEQAHVPDRHGAEDLSRDAQQILDRQLLHKAREASLSR